MKAYTYYEDVKFKDQDELIDLWKRSWERQGFEIIILDRSHAESHPYYEKFVKSLREIHLDIMNKPLDPYGLSCYLRWLAYATQPEEAFYVSDYDVININFKPIKPDDKLHFLDCDCPCIASGTPKQFEALCHMFVDLSKSRMNDLKGVPEMVYHDQNFLNLNFIPKNCQQALELREQYNIKLTRERNHFLTATISNEMKNFQLMHFSHTCCKKYNSQNGLTDRTKITKQACKEYLDL